MNQVLSRIMLSVSVIFHGARISRAEDQVFSQQTWRDSFTVIFRPPVSPMHVRQIGRVGRRVSTRDSTKDLLNLSNQPEHTRVWNVVIASLDVLDNLKKCLEPSK